MQGAATLQSMKLHTWLGIFGTTAALSLFGARANAQYQPPPQQPYPPQPGQPPPPTYYTPPPPTYYAPPQPVQPQPMYSGPPRMDYDDGPIPPGYRVTSRVRKGLIIGGAVSFGVLYVLSVLVADAAKGDSYNDNSYLKSLYIPAIGPFIAMSHTSSGTGVLLLDGIGQVAGLAMFISGFAFPRTELVRNDVATVRMAPMIGQGRSGLALVGTF